MFIGRTGLTNQEKYLSGHFIPVGAVSCLLCRQDFYNSGSSEREMELRSMATRVETEPTLIEESRILKERPFFGWLAVVEGMLQGEAFHFYEGRNITGSSSLCDISLPDEGVQDRHLSIRISPGQWMLTDLDSESGTFLNGKRIYRNELKDGDKIKIGKALLQIKIL